MNKDKAIWKNILKNTIKDINTAVKKHGEWVMFDRGMQEIFDYYPYIQLTSNHSAEEIRDYLLALLEVPVTQLEEDYANYFITDFLGVIEEHVNIVYFDILLADEKLLNLY